MFLNQITHLFSKRLSALNNIYIDSSSILHNYDLFKSLSSHVWPVLKSNAYGHGIGQIATILKQRQFEYLVVDSYYEALQIRQVSNQKILLIGETLPQNIPSMNLKNLALTVQNRQTLFALQKSCLIHLKINTGLNRQGIDINEISDYLGYIKNHPNLKLEGIFSHLADSDNPDSTFTKKQHKLFKKALHIVNSLGFNPKYTHLSATFGSQQIKDPHINTIRLGIGLYGYGPLEGLLPALRFMSTIVKLRQLKKGDPVSYNCTFHSPKNMQIAVIPVGYFEGMDRRLSNIGFVKYQDVFCPIIGQVCMNLSVIDVSGVSPKLYDQVEIISPQIGDKNSIPSISSDCKTIPYDILVHQHESIRRTII